MMCKKVINFDLTLGISNRDKAVHNQIISRGTARKGKYMKMIVNTALCAIVAMSFSNTAFAQVKAAAPATKQVAKWFASTESKAAAQLGAELGLTGNALKSAAAWEAALAKNAALAAKVGAVDLSAANADVVISSVTKDLKGSLVKVANAPSSVVDAASAPGVSCAADLPEQVDAVANVSVGTTRNLMNKGLIVHASCGKVDEMVKQKKTEPLRNLVLMQDCADRKGMKATDTVAVKNDIESACMVEAFKTGNATLEQTAAVSRIEALRSGECKLVP